MNRIVALAWAGAMLVAGYLTLAIAFGPTGDASALVMTLGFALATAFCAGRAWREWKARGVASRRTGAANPNPDQPSAPASVFPGAWRGGRVSLETQIEALKGAGLVLAPGRTLAELLTSWPRADYESDPYNLILFMYGSEVEAEPWGRFFCERGWNFDMECLSEAGDYAQAFTQILRITGQPQLATDISDDFSFKAKACVIRYSINGRQRVLQARIDNDWADPEAVASFVRDIESTIADGRRFWAADNGQASILFFLTDAEAGKVNALRKDVLMRYVRD